MNGRNRFPFTPSQWQELEHQALIYKYMASGNSIPPDLLFTIRRSYLDSPLPSRLMPNQSQHFGWNYLQMGLGRKIDPEPGRCRRTDGKKWRCSKDAYPDSKYCERHMHRGKNRSRKPVEVLKTSTTTNATPVAFSSITRNSPALTPTNNSLSPLSSSCVSSETNHHQSQHSGFYGSHLQHSFLYDHPSSRPSGIGFSFEDNNSSASLFQDTGSYSQTNDNCRYVYGQKEEVDEHAFFTEPSGVMKSFSASSMDDPWQLTPLTMSSSSSSSTSKQRSCSGLSSDYSYLQLQSLSEHSKQQQQDQGCYLLGGEIMKMGKEEPQRTVHRFFDELPHKSREGSWLDLDDKSSTTQLSISIPTFNSRTHHDGT
ncbi:growth-regulating factor 5-like [Lotus japonicus]|uniref:growth-regulating factor 5-like n=1 Tax=Lotus japonicus TaxID=34305 RepID=UPI00258A489A|nr:growth-regulating factor 5-like [Lotus japonicus]